MGAEDKGALDIIGPEYIRPGFTYYDRKGGFYVEYDTGKPKMIKLKNGRFFKYREDYIQYSLANRKDK